jgi:hypothetical protein
MGQTSRILQRVNIQLSLGQFHRNWYERAAQFRSVKDPMAIIKQTLPASLRSGTSAAFQKHGRNAPDRPYLVALPSRKAVGKTREYVALFPHEPEDARITGTTRSLYRRLLALNLPRPVARVELIPELMLETRRTPAGYVGPKTA